MSRSALIVALPALVACVPPRTGTNVLSLPQSVRYVQLDSTGETPRYGLLARVTPDTLYVRLELSDTLAAVPRTDVRMLERERQVVSPGRAVGFGCLFVGGAFGLVTLTGTDDPDSPGLGKALAPVAAAVGCAVGALGGVIVSSVSRPGWEPWVLPDD